MARKPRFILPGVPQHIIQRGNNREPCFYAVEDYYRYLHDLHDAAKKNNAAIHAYVLMTNHVHLLVTPGAPYSIKHMMQDLGRKYIRYINHEQHRTGTLWEGRYKASLVDCEAYLLTCMRYIELNPVRTNMVAHPSEYQCSSYAANTLGKTDHLIKPHPLYQSLASTTAARYYAYSELFRNHLDAEQVHLIREALNQELVLGRDDFKLKIEKMTQRQTNPKPLGRPRVVEEERGIYDIMQNIREYCALTPIILTYMGAGYYDPRIDRFMSIDPVGFDETSPITFNRYAYAKNNSYKFVDLDGRAIIRFNVGLMASIGGIGGLNLLTGKSYGLALSFPWNGEGELDVGFMVSNISGAGAEKLKKLNFSKVPKANIKAGPFGEVDVGKGSVLNLEGESDVTLSATALAIGGQASFNQEGNATSGGLHVILGGVSASQSRSEVYSASRGLRRGLNRVLDYTSEKVDKII